MEDSIPDHKLCGFLCTVLRANDFDHQSKTLEFGTLCHSFSTGSEFGFKSETGVVLTPIIDFSNQNDSTNDVGNLDASSELGGGSQKSEEKEDGTSALTSMKTEKNKKQRKNRMGLVDGSVSVVHQIRVLLNHKCLTVLGRVVGLLVIGQSRGGGGQVWVVMLIDVYLPIALWSGWQFPRSGSTAAAFFRHLSCDWSERTSILNSNKEYIKHIDGDSRNMWKLADCHVLGCKQHGDIADSSKTKLFELHEIFKSLPSLEKHGKHISSRLIPDNSAAASGIWDLTDDILINVLVVLSPLDLVRVSVTCRHLRYLAASIMPCIKLKLFPHQQAAVEWMLHRERNADVLPHPLCLEFSTEDEFHFYINVVSGEIVTGMAPMIRDFRGGLFCDEPGLGKTITALSLILKTQGTLAEPPDGVQVVWCMNSNDQKCGYYECRSHMISGGITTSPGKRSVGQNDRRGQFSLDKLVPNEKLYCFTPNRAKALTSSEQSVSTSHSCAGKFGMTLPGFACSTQSTCLVRGTRSLSHIKKNLLHECEGSCASHREARSSDRYSSKRKHALGVLANDYLEKQVGNPYGSPLKCKRQRKASSSHWEYNETWFQCDACQKWRKIPDGSVADATAAWFCSMNTDPLFQSCNVPEESWDYRLPITYLPGFCDKGVSGGLPENVSFFTSVLQEHYAFFNSQTKKALIWLARLSPDKLSEMETVGLLCPGLVSSGDAHGFHKIFQSFGLVKKVKQGISRWFYPKNINNLSFDLAALRIALCEPLDSFRVYLSRATLIVVPSNLVDHWNAQIQKHVRPGQLGVYVWTDNKKPLVHNLAWEYDVVITTFNRLSAEWSPRKRSVLMQVHWVRIILDEGHTLGSSLSLTNKLQMAISLIASNRWLLTGTPTPNTPNSQLSHLQPMLKFLHEEAYGQNHKSWEAGILKPFEAEMEEGRERLLQLLGRCMISARKADLQCIPPCIKKTTLLNFSEEHAKSYNELVVTVRRNILMADWNDPSHVESLLNPKQWKFRSNTIKNLRLSCCVAGHIKVADAGQDIQETMDILAQSGLEPLSEEYAFIKYNLSYGGNCHRCTGWCRLPIITPCRHILCLDCVALDGERCTLPGCGNSYEMQTPEILTRPENPNPKWPVPKDLIELQPSYKQDNWDPDWQSTSSSKVSYLVERLKEIQAANVHLGCPKSNINNAEGADDFVSSQRRAWNSWSHQETCIRHSIDSCETLSEKVLVFSQFLEHIHVIEQQLTFAGIKFAGMYSPMHSNNKMKSLAIFQQDANCTVLLMDGSAALGLDLSFVTHVFLMEPIWDRSMEEQVISRAHRMGATRPIHVETLAMRGTIEEQMLEFLQNADECRKLLKEENGKHEHQGARAHRSLHEFAERNYLAHLSTVRNKSDL
ncbi:hypothetical protein Ancab_034278 [Ancistrocladus abbreviatus]